MDVWSGNYLNMKSKSHLSFFQLQSYLAKIIEKDEYLTSPYENESGLKGHMKTKSSMRMSFIMFFSITMNF